MGAMPSKNETETQDILWKNEVVEHFLKRLSAVSTPVQPLQPLVSR